MEDLRHIAVPFAQGYIHQHFLPIPALVMVVYTVAGEASLGTRLGVVVPLAYGPLAGADVQVKANYRLSSLFETRVSRLADGNINIKLDSRDSRTAGAGAELGVKLDLSQPLLPIHAALSGALAEAREVIDLLQTEWVFDNGFETLLKEHLAGISDHKDWRNFVETGLKTSPQTSFADAAKNALSDHLSDRATSWRSAATVAVDDLIDAALDGLAADQMATLSGVIGTANLPTLMKSAARDALDEATARFLAAAASQSDSLVNKLVKTANLKRFQSALDPLAPAATKLADVRVQVLVYFNRYLTYLETIKTTVRVLSENQLAAKFSYYRSRSRGTSVLADVTVTPHAAKRFADALDDLLAGKPDDLIALYDRGEPGIQLNECLLGRFVQSQRPWALA